MGRGLYPLLSLVGGLVEVLVQLVQIKIHFTLSPLPPYLSSGRLVQGGLIAQRPGGAQVPHARLPLHPVDEHQEEGFVREPVERGGQQAVKCYGVCAAGIVTDGGQDFYLMEHDAFGDEAANIIVDSAGIRSLPRIFGTASALKFSP